MISTCFIYIYILTFLIPTDIKQVFKSEKSKTKNFLQLDIIHEAAIKFQDKMFERGFREKNP